MPSQRVTQMSSVTTLNNGDLFYVVTNVTGTDGNNNRLTFQTLKDSIPGSSGTVSSVALTMPSGFSVAGSPITSSGTLAVTSALSGIIKVTAGAFGAASAGIDYVAPGAVTTSGLTQATGTILGRSTAGTGAIQEIAIGANLTLSGGTLSATGGGGMSIGGSVTSGTTGSILFVGSGPVLAQDNANLFWDDTNNRLGIGTATPGFTFELRSNKSGQFGDLGATPADFDILWFIETTNKDHVARLGFFNNSAGDGGGGAIIESGIQGGNINTSYMSFRTRPNVGTTVEAARFDKDQNMGIGCTSAGARLQVQGATDGGSFIRVDGPAATAKVMMGSNEGTGYTYAGSLSNHQYRFMINNSEVARFDTSGNLLLGTTTSSGRLHVVGDYQFNEFDIGSSPAAHDATLYIQSVTGGQPARIRVGAHNGGYGMIEGNDDTSANTGYMAFRVRTGAGTSGEAYRIGSNLQLKTVAGNETTGGGSALLGTNSPAVTNTAPFTWWKVTTSDGSQGYIPVWK